MQQLAVGPRGEMDWKKSFHQQHISSGSRFHNTIFSRYLLSLSWSNCTHELAFALRTSLLSNFWYLEEFFISGKRQRQMVHARVRDLSRAVAWSAQFHYLLFFLSDVACGKQIFFLISRVMSGGSDLSEKEKPVLIFFNKKSENLIKKLFMFPPCRARCSRFPIKHAVQKKNEGWNEFKLIKKKFQLGVAR